MMVQDAKTPTLCMESRGTFFEKFYKKIRKTLDFYTPMWYNIYNEKERRKTVSKKKPKKNGNQEKTLKILILITAILNLIKSVVDLIQRFTE